jgi:hypothetical protein
VRLLDDAAERLATADNRLLVTELLDSGLSPDLALPARPVSTTLVTTLELAAVRSERPQRPAALALELVRQRYGTLDGTAEPAGFVRRVVAEQADAVRAVRSRLEAAGDVRAQLELTVGGPERAGVTGR